MNYININKSKLLLKMLADDLTSSGKSSTEQWLILNSICKKIEEYKKSNNIGLLVEIARELRTKPEVLEDKDTKKLLLVTVSEKEYKNLISDKSESLYKLFEIVGKNDAHIDRYYTTFDIIDINKKILRDGYSSVYIDEFTLSYFNGISNMMNELPSGIDIFYNDNGLLKKIRTWKEDEELL